MYGMIHKALRELAIERAGENAWREIATECKLGSEHFISGQHYSDDVTNALINAVAEKAGMAPEALLKDFGRSWIRFVQGSTYAGVLDMAGGDLVTFLENLDRMHASIKATMPEAVTPSFHVETRGRNDIIVTYASPRQGLAPFVEGLLEGVLERFNEKGEISSKPLKDGGAEFRIKRASRLRVA